MNYCSVIVGKYILLTCQMKKISKRFDSAKEVKSPETVIQNGLLCRE